MSIEKELKLSQKLNLICKIRFGSHLYGTSTESSDVDYQGVYLPNIRDILLNRIKKSINLSTNKSATKNNSDDEDFNVYSLHHFIKLACEGQTIAIDMLNANDENIIETSETWNEIVKNKHLFYSKQMRAFIGYARRQAFQYGDKGKRLGDAEEFYEFLNKFEGDKVLNSSFIWNSIPNLNNLKKEESVITTKGKNIKQISICGRKIQETCKVQYAKEIVQSYISKYGARAKAARDNKGIDWKAVSHALRICYELKEIYQTGKIIFPLKEASFILRIKRGEHGYVEDVLPVLENLMNDIESLVKMSSYPEKVETGYWDDFIVRCFNNV